MNALDPEPLLRFLHEQGVAHISIGGVAVAAPGLDADDLYVELDRDALAFALGDVPA